MIDTNQVIDNLRRSTVAVGIRYGDGMDFRGSGVLVRHEGGGVYVLTALHVTTNIQARLRAGEIEAGGRMAFGAFPVVEYSFAPRAEVYGEMRAVHALPVFAAFQSLDIIAFRVPDEPASCHALEVASTGAEDGTPIVVSGFPGQPDGAAVRREVLGTIVGHDEQRLMLDCAAEPGQSGGPVCRLEDGALLGILTNIQADGAQHDGFALRHSSASVIDGRLLNQAAQTIGA